MGAIAQWLTGGSYTQQAQLLQLWYEFDGAVESPRGSSGTPRLCSQSPRKRLHQLGHITYGMSRVQSRHARIQLSVVSNTIQIDPATLERRDTGNGLKQDVPPFK